MPYECITINGKKTGACPPYPAVVDDPSPSTPADELPLEETQTTTDVDGAGCVNPNLVIQIPQSVADAYRSNSGDFVDQLNAVLESKLPANYLFSAIDYALFSSELTSSDPKSRILAGGIACQVQPYSTFYFHADLPARTQAETPPPPEFEVDDFPPPPDAPMPPPELEQLHTELVNRLNESIDNQTDDITQNYEILQSFVLGQQISVLDSAESVFQSAPHY